MISNALLIRIQNAILAGLSEEKEHHLDDARRNLDFYRGNFKAWQPKFAGRDGYDGIRKRYSLVMQRAVNTLTANLYKDGPKRSMPGHPEAGAWLEWVYRTNCLDATLQEADRMTLVSDVALLQAVPTPDPNKPVDIQLWDASEFAVWMDPDNRKRPAAVAVMDRYNEQRRLRLWTDEVVFTYLTDPLAKGQTAGGTAYRPAGERPNDLGMLPFTSAHYSMPIQDFWTPGPGDFLCEVNDAANAALTQVGGGVTFNLLPILLLKNIAPWWRPPAPIKPGDVYNPPGDESRADGNGGGEPGMEYVSTNPAFVQASWDDLNAYITHTLEMIGVPPGAIRMEQSSYQSGVAIVSEQLPLILWAKGRQRPWAWYEDNLARLVLVVGAKHFAANADLDLEYKVTAEQLEAAAPDPGLTLRWPKMYPDLPGAEQDQSDQWLLDNRLASPQGVLRRRESMTDDEVDAYVGQVAEDWKKWHELFGSVETAEAENAAAKVKILNQAKGDEPTNPKAERPNPDEPDGDESED